MTVENLTTTISNGYTHYFEDFLQRVLTLSGDLTEEEFWKKPYPYGNSVGHLTLHLIGNLNTYIGAELGGTGYVRDREREFTDAHPPAKSEALATLKTTVEMVNAVVRNQRETDWSEPYRAVGVDDVHNRFDIILRCAVHFHHHIGQMFYLKQEHLRLRG
jgi:hypothetical protein